MPWDSRPPLKYSPTERPDRSLYRFYAPGGFNGTLAEKAKGVHSAIVFFKIIGGIADIQKIASGKGIRERRRLLKLYGGRQWRKLKGTATVQFPNGTICHAEVHWYEAHGVGAKEFKVKRILGIQ